MAARGGSVFTKNDYAYVELRDRILTGVLPAGSVLPQGRLAQEIGVSTTPLREAVRRLAAEGLILLEAHRDARVAEVTAAEARHLYEVRASVDPLAAALAASRRTDDDLEQIRRAEAELRPLSGNATLEALIAHREFHRSIYRASGNPLLVDVLERLWDKADRYRMVALEARRDSEEDSRRVAEEHRQIAAAVESGDPAAAEHAMREHIDKSLGRRAIAALEGTDSNT
ncbi:GntR family transcriptional regulator [Cellulosimicrobium funkei]|nr:GntR family transcriptional regulator [Cellulosimicrobium funkei]